MQVANATQDERLVVSSLGQRARMQRREFIAVLSLAAAWPLAVQAQQPEKVALIGFLATGSLEAPETHDPNCYPCHGRPS